MKRIAVLCLIGVATLDAWGAMSNLQQPVKAFSAVVWKTTTLHSPAGKATTFMQRTIYIRDASGTLRREIYQPTKGLQHDTSAPLERVLTGLLSAEGLPTTRLSKEVSEQDVDLGTLQFFGVPAGGKSQTFVDASGQRTRTLETWFSATLGMTVRMKSSNARGDTVFSDLSELHLGSSASSSTERAPIATSGIPLLTLYRGLFAEIAHMERERQENAPNLRVNMDEIEGHLRQKMNLFANEWQALVDKSVKVDNYTLAMSKRARTFADQDRLDRKENSLSANTPSAGRATLHQMQVDLNSHVQGEIDQLKASVGPGGTNHIETYLQGPLATSITVIPLHAARLRMQKEQAR